jgi:hypothetical protein
MYEVTEERLVAQEAVLSKGDAKLDKMAKMAAFSSESDDSGGMCTF